MYDFGIKEFKCFIPYIVYIWCLLLFTVGNLFTRLILNNQHVHWNMQTICNIIPGIPGTKIPGDTKLGLS